MGFRADKQPFVGEVASGVVQAFGCNGMGVAIGSTIAEEAAVVTLQHG
jgi:glycine/D-amino acid oxidase-like deaminating enzyme